MACRYSLHSLFAVWGIFPDRHCDIARWPGQDIFRLGVSLRGPLWGNGLVICSLPDSMHGPGSEDLRVTAISHMLDKCSKYWLRSQCHDKCCSQAEAGSPCQQGLNPKSQNPRPKSLITMSGSAARRGMSWITCQRSSVDWHLLSKPSLPCCSRRPISMQWTCTHIDSH